MIELQEESASALAATRARAHILQISRSVRERSDFLAMAQRLDVIGLVLRQGMELACLGVLIGLGCSLVLTKFTRSLLFGITPTDPVTFIRIPSLLVAVALLACSLPAQRAAEVDPMEALRYE